MDDTYGCIPVYMVIAVKELTEAGNGKGDIRSSTNGQVLKGTNQGPLRNVHQLM